MRFRNIVWVAGALGLACEQNPAAPSSAGATHTYDVVADFSTTSNSDTSVWSYRYQIGFARDGNYLLLSGYGPDVIEQWTPIDPGAWRAQGYLPAIGVNATTSDDSIIGTGLTWPRGAMLVHPNYDGLVVLTWRSPSAAVVTVEFSFTSLHRVCGDGIDWFVEHNSDTATMGSGSLDPGGSTGTRRLTGVRVQAGDRINFIVGPRAGYACDSTQLTATITTG